jgi:DNA repair exonuclease SbcCD ATPase subunit
MTEIAESWNETTDIGNRHIGNGGTSTFAAFVGRLEEETGRLRSLAEAAEATARELAEREATLDARERALSVAQRELDTRRQELEGWQRELNDLAAQTEKAEARIAEAAEREAGLRALANDLLHRYSDGQAHD